MSDTPRTDAAVWIDPTYGGAYVPVGFAEQLERENARLRDLLDCVLVRGCEWTHSTHPVPADACMRAIWDEVCVEVMALEPRRAAA